MGSVSFVRARRLARLGVGRCLAVLRVRDFLTDVDDERGHRDGEEHARDARRATHLR